MAMHSAHKGFFVGDDVAYADRKWLVDEIHVSAHGYHEPYAVLVRDEALGRHHVHAVVAEVTIAALVKARGY